MMPFDTMDHLPAKLPGPPGAYGLLLEDANRAMVFVHGFFGDADSTWRNFQGLIDPLREQFPWWQESDLYFYSYRSEDQVVPQARLLRTFLKDTVLSGRDAGPNIYRSFVLPSGFTIETAVKFSRNYKRLVLVGHSTGAVIIRQAVLDEIGLIDSEPTHAKRQDLIEAALRSSLLASASLLFFAPAHLGAICSGPLGKLLSIPVTETLLLFELRSKPLFHNIQPGSPVLEGIHRETEKLQQQYENLGLLRAYSLFGSEDAIVNIYDYAQDPKVQTEPGQGHTSICKPKIDVKREIEYTKPLRFIVDADLRRAAP